MLAAQHADQGFQVVGFSGVQPGCRFVEHQNARARHHAAGDFQTALLTVGQCTGRAVSEFLEVDGFQPVLGVVHGFAFAATERRGFEQTGQEVGIQMPMLGNQQVLYSGHF